jgi:DNA-binding CsgD family transcriptional regulator
MAYGRWQPYVDAKPVREHVQSLCGGGLGCKRIAAAAGCSASAVRRLLGIEGNRPATRRMLPATAAALLAVTLTPDLRQRPALTDAAGTVRRLQALIAAGHCRLVLAERLGMGNDSLNRLIRTAERVRVITAAAVRALYDELWDVPADETTPLAARRAARARADGLANGWPLPAAWDDQAIDNPDAPVPDGWQRESFHGGQRAEDIAEDALELLGRHYTRAEAADRLGVKRNTLDKAIERVRRRGESEDQSDAA